MHASACVQQHGKLVLAHTGDQISPQTHMLPFKWPTLTSSQVPLLRGIQACPHVQVDGERHGQTPCYPFYLIFNALLMLTHEGGSLAFGFAHGQMRAWEPQLDFKT